jgi:hypothetical protein
VDARDLSKHLMHLPAKENPPMMTVTFTIKGIISSSEGKFASNLLNRIFVIEQKNLP